MKGQKAAAPSRAAEKGRLGTTVGSVLQKREVSLAILLVIFGACLTAATDTFLQIANFRVLLQGMATDMMIAIPMCISLIAGNIDFSAGSALCLNGAICGLMMNHGASVPVAILVGLLCGFLLGALNGAIINQLGLTPLVATMGTWMAYRGAALVLLGGGTLSSFPESFLILGRATVLGVPITIVYMLIVVVAGILLLKYSNFFHNAYFIGSNKASAKLAGINVERFTVITYAITGAIASFAGIILAARLGSCSQNAGESLEFRNVVGLLVGGVSMDGGVGSVLGAMLGVMLMQMVGNAITLLYLNTSYTKLINGCILILAVGLDVLLKKKKAKV
ncbi:MAG: ABC transporter permease [Oscillospiraceae bacterium]|nr:ABC transporter permease [Oscillospiraceae bacterium]